MPCAFSSSLVHSPGLYEYKSLYGSYIKGSVSISQPVGGHGGVTLLTHKHRAWDSVVLGIDLSKVKRP